MKNEISTKPHSEWRDVPSYRAYAVLTLCRIFYTFKEGTVVSKPRAPDGLSRTCQMNSARSFCKRWRSAIRRSRTRFPSLKSNASSILPIPSFRLSSSFGGYGKLR